VELRSEPGGNFPALNLHWLDFVFAAAVLVGIYAMRRLALVIESGSLKDKLPLSELTAEMRSTVRNISNVAGLRPLSSFPYGILRRRTPYKDDDSRAS
jgi:hypothetical protein